MGGRWGGVFGFLVLGVQLGRDFCGPSTSSASEARPQPTCGIPAPPVIPVHSCGEATELGDIEEFPSFLKLSVSSPARLNSVLSDFFPSVSLCLLSSSHPPLPAPSFPRSF